MKRRPFARDVEAEFEADLSFHWEELEDALVARGMDRAHAREEVLRRKGNAETLERKLAAMGERSERRADRREWLGTVWQDLRFGLRTLRRSANQWSRRVVGVIHRTRITAKDCRTAKGRGI